MATITFSTFDEASKVFDAIKIVAENDDQVEEYWNKISKKSLDELKKQFKKKTPRGKTSYQMYSTDPDVKNKLTNGKKLSIGEMSQLVSKSWRELSSEEQHVFKLKADEYNKTHNLGSSNKPKKAKTPYNIYIGDKELRQKFNSENDGKLSMIEINKLMSAKWKTLSVEEKKPYEDKAQQLKEQLTTEPLTTEPLTTEPLTTEPLTTEPLTTEHDESSKNNKKKKKTTTKK